MKLKSGWDKWRDYEILRLKLVYEVLELCCFEWFQNKGHYLIELEVREDTEEIGKEGSND